MTKKPRRWLRGLGLFVVATLLALALGVYWRLSRGAVSLDLVESRLERAFNSELAPRSVDLEGGTFRWSGFDRPVSIRYSEVRLSDGRNAALARVSGVSVDLSVAALLRGEVAPVRLDVERLRVAVVRNQDGSWAVALGGGKPASEEESPSLIQSLLEPLQPQSPLGQLRRIRIDEAEVEVDDRKLGFTWSAEEIALEIDRDETGLEVRLALDPNLDQPLGRITADGSYSFEDREARARAEFDALKLAALARLSPALEPLLALESPLKGWVEANLDQGYEPVDLQFDVSSEPFSLAGRVDFAKGIRSPAAKLQLTDLQPWRLAGSTEALAPLRNLRLSLGGNLDLVVEEGGLQHAKVGLQTGSGKLTVPGLYDAPLDLGATTITASVENGAQTLRVDQLRTTLGASTLVVGLTAEKSATGYQGQLRADVDKLAVERLALYWPPQAARGARSWVVENIPGGMLENLELDLVARLELDEERRFRILDLQGSFDLQELEVRALSPQPPITGIEGKAAITSDSLDFELTAGHLGDIEVGNSTVTIAGLDGQKVDLEAQIECSTDVASAIQLISVEPLSLIDERVISANDVSGRAEATVRLGLPLSGPAGGRKTEVSVEARVQDFSWLEAPLDLELSQGDLQVSYAELALRVQGQVAAAGVPASVDYLLELDGTPSQTIEARARLTQSDRDRLGIPEQSVVTGPLTGKVRYTVGTDEAVTVAAEIDLRESDMELRLFEWRKPAGDPARATVAARKSGAGSWSISSADITAPDLVLQGSAEIELDPFRLATLQIKRFDLRENRLRGEVSRGSGDDLQMRVRGDYLDIHRLPQRLTKSRAARSRSAAGPPDTQSLTLELDIKEIASAGAVILEGLSGKGKLEGGRPRAFEIRAQSRSGHELRADFGPGENGQVGHVQASDAGDLMKTLGLTTLFEGGELELTATRAAAEENIDLHLDISEIELVESPVLENIFQLGSLDGLRAALQGEGFVLKRVHGVFELDDEELRIEEGQAYGNNIALTFVGSVDLLQDSCDLQGIAAPTGTVRRHIGKIPGVGTILMGPRKGGFLGTKFAITGPVSDPEVKAQPLSVLTPGILRELSGLMKPSRHEEPPR